MKIKIKYIKLLKLKNIENDSVIEIPDKYTVRDLLTFLEISRIRQDTVLPIINGENVWPATRLKENDEVNLTILISGG